MLTLEPLTYQREYLDEIATERNKTLISLRTDWVTQGIKQIDWIDNLDPKIERYFFIFIEDLYTKNKRLIGYCGLDKINHINQNAELSLLIFRSYKGNGFGRETVNKLFEYGFLELNLNCIYIEVYGTTKSWEFWNKCGFVKEGVLRKRKKWQGEFYDTIVASILKCEHKGG